MKKTVRLISRVDSQYFFRKTEPHNLGIIESQEPFQAVR